MLPTINTIPTIPSNVLEIINIEELQEAERRVVMTKYVQDYNFPLCIDASQYEKVNKIGQGSFGEVFKARDKRNCQFVALKRVMMKNEKEGFPVTSLREIKILQKLNHENVVNLLDIVKSNPTETYGKSTFYLALEFCEHDLSGLLGNSNVKFNLGEIKKVLQQLWNGLYYLHENSILHRDVKSSNILITKTGVLKIADFGLARPISSCKKRIPNSFTNRVVTRWYRAPELLLGDRNYGPGIDMWATGCIMAEMWTRNNVMQGNSEGHQLWLISQLCGSITPAVWPGVQNLPLYTKMVLPQNCRRKVIQRLKPYIKDTNACDLLDKILTLDPSNRIDADTALNHDFFWTDPMPCDLRKMMACHTTSMFAYLRQEQENIRPLVFFKPRRPKQTTSAAINEGYHDKIF